LEIGIVKGHGLKIEGYSFGSISTSKNTSIATRLDHIFSELLHILKNEKPDLMGDRIGSSNRNRAAGRLPGVGSGD
jgi:Holliday junction resolvasome RuvABC endonuclease subunit